MSDYSDIIDKYNEINKNDENSEPVFSILEGKGSTTIPPPSTTPGTSPP